MAKTKHDDNKKFQKDQSMKVNGFSRYPLKADIHLAPTAPSTARWSQLRVTFITLATLKPFSSSGAGTMVACVAPTARMHDWGGLMMAVKCEMPYMPKFEMVNVPPYGVSTVSQLTYALDIAYMLYLVLLWLELAVASLLRQSLGS